MSFSVTMDEFGRIRLPKALQNLLKTNKFTLESDAHAKEMKLKPVPTWDEMVGFIKNKIDLKDLVKDRETQWH
jgi:DNA-binding transcriptional regulator/RsmH inhibitor MraZ